MTWWCHRLHHKQNKSKHVTQCGHRGRRLLSSCYSTSLLQRLEEFKRTFEPLTSETPEVWWAHINKRLILACKGTCDANMNKQNKSASTCLFSFQRHGEETGSVSSDGRGGETRLGGDSTRLQPEEERGGATRVRNKRYQPADWLTIILLLPFWYITVNKIPVATETATTTSELIDSSESCMFSFMFLVLCGVSPSALFITVAASWAQRRQTPLWLKKYKQDIKTTASFWWLCLFCPNKVTDIHIYTIIIYILSVYIRLLNSYLNTLCSVQ